MKSLTEDLNFILFNHFLSAFHVPGIVLDTGISAVNHRDKVPQFSGVSILERESNINHKYMFHIMINAMKVG